MLFVNNCTFILSNKNEIIYHQETSMLRSLSTDTITHTTNQTDKETSKPTLLELEIETGRYVPIFDKTLKKNRKRTANERICKLCRLNDIENEYHFLCVCPVYNSRRKLLFVEIELKHVHFHTLSLSDKFIFVM